MKDLRNKKGCHFDDLAAGERGEIPRVIPLFPGGFNGSINVSLTVFH